MPVAYQYLPVGFYGAAETERMSCAGRKLVFSASIVALMLISPDFSFIMYNTKGFILRSFFLWNLMRSYFIPMKEEIILCISLQITCLRKISVCSDFVTFKGAVGYSPIPPSPSLPRRIAHLSSLRHLAFPKLMDFQNPVRGPAVLVAVNCQRGQACSCACGDDLITFTEVGRPTHYGWHHSLSKEFWVV